MFSFGLFCQTAQEVKSANVPAELNHNKVYETNFILELEIL